MTKTQAITDLPTALQLCKTEAVIIDGESGPEAVVISYERYDQLMEALEDLEDLKYLEENPPDYEGSIPWEDVKRDLGL